MSYVRSALLGAAFFIVFPHPAFACDLCAIYNSVESQRFEAGSFRLGVSEQFTYYGRVQDGGDFAGDETGQHLASSQTQLLGQYDITSRFGVQVGIPYINRRYSRLKEDGMDRGTEAGIGDLAVLGKALIYSSARDDFTFSWVVSAGLKLPTGDSDRLAEEGEEGRGHGEEEEHEEEEHGDERRAEPGIRHGGVDHGPRSAIHGHDLALGSGSVDVPIGTTIFARLYRWFVVADAAYVFRTEGHHDYRYADDFTWLLSPGYYLALGDEGSASLAMQLAGERKGKDRSNGEDEPDTRFDSVFLGPALTVNAGARWIGELAAHFPLDVDNSGLQVTPEYRLRAAATYRF